MATLSLISRWFLRPGCEATALAAVEQLAAAVQAHEPGTLTYYVHTPDTRLQSLPPADPHSLLFFEEYRDPAAFHAHVTGPLFTAFVHDHGHLFVTANGKPFTFVEFLTRRAGFTRSEPAEPQAVAANAHPAVMFEIIANDQANLKAFYQTVFHWNYTIGTGDFAYVKFPVQTLPLLGGIGQANPQIPGFDPGHNFYLLVDDLQSTITAALAAGASKLADPVDIDGYHFAMIKDPEGNPIGLIQPFAAN